MKTKIVSYTLLLLVTIFAACKKEIKPVVLSDLKDILSFKLEASLNNVLDKDIVGVIHEDTITLTVVDTVNVTNTIATFSTSGIAVFVVDTEQKSGVTPNDFSKKLIYTVKAEDGSVREYIIDVKKKAPDFKPGVPHLYIITENGAAITSKKDYIKASLKIEGLGAYRNYEGATKIRGRGNSTWNYPKKPYKLKLSDAAPLLGLPAAKKWILLANYLDGTLMLNSIAMRTGQLLEMPYTNHIIPVDVTINGTYAGSYAFTEQKEVGPNRVDLKEGGVWLEMDTNYDEDFKFNSAVYGLPVMVHYPELKDLTTSAANAALAKIQTDFNTMEQAVSSTSFPDNNYLDYIDTKAMVDYLIVYNLCQNEEINHPKSTYMYLSEGGKYTMGPIWDFDWAFNYKGGQYFASYTSPLFWTGSFAKSGSHFFSRFLGDPAIQTLYKQEWTSFRTNKFDSLISYLDDYAKLIEDSQQKDYAVWKRGSGNFKADIQKLRTWLQNRASYIDSYVALF